MIHERIPVDVFCPALARAGIDSRAELTVWARDGLGVLAEDGGRWGVIVLPGGGYRVHAATESEPVALSFLGGGCQAFVLNYSLAPARYPTQLLELAGAVLYLRENREKYGISRVAVCGLSAGGHLAGCLANLWAEPMLPETLGCEAALLRPDALVLCYPVISAKTPKRSPAFGKILGEGVPVEGEWEKLSLETSVTSGNPPTFLWATTADPQVSAEHTLRYANALQRAHVPFELHLFQNGPHAMSLATEQSAREALRVSPHVARWMPLALEWLSGETLSGAERM